MDTDRVPHRRYAPTMTASPEPAFGVDSMVTPLRRVAMRAPGAILHADPSDWHYAKTVNPDALEQQYRRFVDLVRAGGAEIVWIPDEVDDLADSIFTFDPSFVVPGGTVLLRPGKPGRHDEVALHRAFYDDANIPIVGQIEAPGTIEGGDLLWLDPSTIAVGRGFRTNQAGIDQFRSIVAPVGIDVLVFDLPYHRGPDACLHLLSLVNPLDDDLALIHAPLLPAALHETLTERGIELLEAPPGEFAASGGLSLNVLATAPRRCIAIAGFPATVAFMEEAGCTVETFEADELCLPCEGGPTCLTRPLLRG